MCDDGMIAKEMILTASVCDDRMTAKEMILTVNVCDDRTIAKEMILTASVCDDRMTAKEMILTVSVCDDRMIAKEMILTPVMMMMTRKMKTKMTSLKTVLTKVINYDTPVLILLLRVDTQVEFVLPLNHRI